MKSTVISVLIAIVLIGGAVLFSRDDQAPSTENVSIIDGKQVITINAKGGYFPKVTAAKAGIPTVIKMDTQGTFDCTAALTIPDLNYQATLPPSGVTEIAVSSQEAGEKLKGLCSMGMYNFSINFN